MIKKNRLLSIWTSVSSTLTKTISKINFSNAHCTLVKNRKQFLSVKKKKNRFEWKYIRNWQNPKDYKTSKNTEIQKILEKSPKY